MPFRCGSAVLALLVLVTSVAGSSASEKLAASDATDPDKAWLDRSRKIMERANEQPAPDWLRQEATEEALAAAEEVATQSRAARRPPGGPDVEKSVSVPDRVLIFGSFSVPEATLRALLDEATRPNVMFVLRGVPKGASIQDAHARLKRLFRSKDEVPNVILDPTLFRRHAVTTVPTLVLERGGGKKTIKVTGAMTVDWLRRQAGSVSAGGEDLGRRAESYEIAEKDLILEMQERMANIDWDERRRAAIQNFWRKRRDFVELPDAPAARTFLVDPSVRITQDLEDADGNILVHAGETFNPLNWAPLSKTIVVFRGTDARHVAVAAKAAREARAGGRGVILLTTTVDTDRGWEHLDDLERDLVGAVYLMPQSLVERLHLSHIPATIVSRGAQLVVTEFPVKAAL